VVAIRLTRQERQSLEEVTRHQRGEARTYRRARMVLLATSGESISSIARQLGTCRLRVGQWLHRFEERRLFGLQDHPRWGRPIEITPLERHQVIAAACQSPKDFAVARNTWTHESLRDAVVAQGLVRRISTSEVGRILDEADLKPRDGVTVLILNFNRRCVRSCASTCGGRPARRCCRSTRRPVCRRFPEVENCRRPRQGARAASSSTTGATERAACLLALTWAPDRSWVA
jgi:transposase